MDAIVPRLSLVLLASSSSCLTQVSKSDEGPDIVWVDGGARGSSARRDWEVELEAFLR